MRKLWLITFGCYVFLAGCSENISNQVENTKDSNIQLTEVNEIQEATFYVEEVKFSIDYPVDLEITEDDDLAFNLEGNNGEIFFDGFNKEDLKDLDAFINLYKSDLEELYKKNMEPTDVTIAGFKGKKTDIEYSDEGMVLRDISYYLDTGEVYLFVNQSGYKSFFSDVEAHTEMLNSLAIIK